MPWHFKNLLGAIAKILFHRHNSWDDFSGLLDENGVADADVFSLDFLLIVQRGP